VTTLANIRILMDPCAIDDNDHGVTSILTPKETMKMGLKLVGFKKRRILRVLSRKTNIDRFKGFFGASPAVYAEIWEDLQKTDVVEARVPVQDRNPKCFLMAMHHLKRYPTELEREAMFDISRMWGRDWCWYFIEKVQALKAQKIVWPDKWDDIWALTVDGQHCWVHEQLHPIWSQDPQYFSHKYSKAGLNYELAIALFKNQVVSMKGPYPAGSNDLQIFTTKGLEEKLLADGVKAIGDGGYHGHQKSISAPNPHDSKGVRMFKSRALLRHETFNGHMKKFDCLSGRFRHSVERFENCFEAVCVICQHQIEIESPLFDVIAEGMFD
jgi:hypothetical protein